MKLNVLEWCSSETHHVMKLVCALRHPLLDNKLQKTKKMVYFRDYLKPDQPMISSFLNQ
jgi:hypothetical protein